MRPRPSGFLMVALAVSVATGLCSPPPAWALVQGTQSQPVPMPLRVRVTPTPTGSVVSWQAVAGATSYTLRRWKRTGNQNRCCEQVVRSIGDARFVDSLLTGDGTYIYRIVAHLRDGRRGFEEHTVQLAAPAFQPRNPRDFAAAQTGAGTVSLSWSPVPRAVSYHLTGPGTGSQGLRVDGTNKTLTGLPEGRLEWQLVTQYQHGIAPDNRNPSRASVMIEPVQPPPGVAISPTSPATAPAHGDGLPTIANPPQDVARRMPPGATGTTPSGDPVASVPAMPTTGTEPSSAEPSNQQPAGVQPAAGQPADPRDLRSRPVLVPVAASNPTDATPSSPAAPAASGRYLVTVTGLRAGWTTKDGIGIIDQDGKGDEIMAAAFVRRYDRATAQPLEYTNLQTMVYGDVNGYQNERVQAGRLTILGGITDGDPIPADGPVARSLPAQTSVFPWKLWEGTLTDGGDALVISPSIWEYDGNPVDFFPWGQNQQMLNNTIFLSARLQEQIDAKRFGPLVLGANETSTNRFDSFGKFFTEGAIGAAMGLPPLASILGRQRDRPIGLVANGDNSTALPNTTVVLTREIVEAALATPASGVVNPMPYILIPMVKPGIMVIDFRDRAFASANTPADGFFDRKAFYSMILQVERVP